MTEGAKTEGVGNGQRARQRGVTLIESMFAIGVVILSIMGLVASLLQGMALDQASRETELAMNAAREVLETMRGTDQFSEIYVRYNSDTEDDPTTGGERSEVPNSRVSISASTFTVKGLSPRSDSGGNFVGRIEFPESTSTGGSPSLREDLVDEEPDEFAMIASCVFV